MNKQLTSMFLALIMTATVINAQETSTQKPESDYITLENKLKKSNGDLEDPKKNITAKYWDSRAELMMDIYEVNRKYIEGQAKVSINFFYGKEKEIKKEEKDGKLFETFVYDRVNIVYENGVVYNYIETKPIQENPLPLAMQALAKAEEFNADGKQTKKIAANYKRLSELFVHKGGRVYYYNQDNKNAFEAFVSALTIQQKPFVGIPTDTALMYNAGIIAHYAEMTDESMKYLTMAKDLNYPEAKIYVYLKQDYFVKADTATGVQILKEGFSKFPESQDIVVEFINYFLVTEKTTEALEYIKLAQKKDPKNITLVFAEATLYDKMKETDKAIENYKKCIDLKPDYFDAYFNLGVVYYYYAQDIYKKASNAPDKEFASISALGDEQLRNAIEPLEKCVTMLEAKPALDTDEQKTLLDVYETLKSIYYRFKMNDKYEIVKAKLKK